MTMPLDSQLVIALFVLLHIGPIIWAVFAKSVSKLWLLIFVLFPIAGPALFLAKRASDRRWNR